MNNTTTRNLYQNVMRSLSIACLWLSMAILGLAQGSGKRSGEIIVSFKPGADYAAFHARHRTQVRERINGSEQYLLTLAPGERVEDKLSDLAGDSQVLFASANYNVQIAELLQTSQAYVDQTSQAYVDQTSQAYVDQTSQAYVDSVLSVRFYGQPTISRLRLMEAQRLTRGLGIRVAVIDTGIDLSHPLLAGRIVWPNFDFVDNDATPRDEAGGAGYGHGTFVAGLVASTAPGALIMPLRAFGPDGSGTSFNIAKAIRFAADNGAQVINMSFGLLERDTLIDDALNYAQSRSYMVAAAGNSNQEFLNYPAGRSNRTLAVTATDATDRKAGFSNYHRNAQAAAPGVALYSAYPGNRWAWWSGTSFSTGLVAGQAALLLQLNPGLNRNQLDGLITGSGANLDGVNPQYAGKLGARIDYLQSVNLLLSNGGN